MLLFFTFTQTTTSSETVRLSTAKKVFAILLLAPTSTFGGIMLSCFIKKHIPPDYLPTPATVAIFCLGILTSKKFTLQNTCLSGGLLGLAIGSCLLYRGVQSSREERLRNDSILRLEQTTTRTPRVSDHFPQQQAHLENLRLEIQQGQRNLARESRALDARQQELETQQREIEQFNLERKQARKAELQKFARKIPPTGGLFRSQKIKIRRKLLRQTLQYLQQLHAENNDVGFWTIINQQALITDPSIPTAMIAPFTSGTTEM